MSAASAMSMLSELIEVLELAKEAERWHNELLELREAVRPYAELLTNAERLLAEGQHGKCDAVWKRRVRDYFSHHYRGELINAMNSRGGGIT